MACNATILEGPRKGQPCEFPPSDNGFCGRHQRHYEHEQLLKENKIPCRLFFRGCDTIVQKEGSCDECKSKLSKKITTCQHEKCTFKTANTKYCKKHSRDIYRDEEKEKNIKYCDISRGCLTICKEGYTKCETCRNKSYIKEKTIRKQRVEQHNALEIIGNKEQLCINCGKSYEQFITSHKKPSMICKGCNDYNALQDIKRVDRMRNYQGEQFRNMEAYFNSTKNKASTRNYSFNIDFDIFKSLVLSECYYCHHQKNDEVNGIDRINNAIGYEKDNCVSCCKVCNRMKWIFHPLFFVQVCKLISGFEVSSSSFYELWKEYYVSRPACYSKSKHIAEKDRQLAFSLSKEEWQVLVQQPCYLCGFQSKSGIGLDRVESTKREYTLENVKPCCYTCNILKTDFTLEQIQEQATLISCIWTDTSSFECIPRSIGSP
jgi:hypothetical protein